MNNSWYTVSNVDEIPSPSLLVYPSRVAENIRRMLVIAGGPARLRPHVKTHKMPEMIRRQLESGINQFKCATLAEAEMTASAGATDVLFAYQPVGPNIDRLVQLIRSFPATRFSALADDAKILQQLSEAVSRANLTLDVLLDLDCGMQRSGISPGPDAVALYRLIQSLPGLIPAGLQVYDGHIHDKDVAARTAAADREFAPALALREELLAAGLPVPKIVAGGTPTFPIHARRDSSVQCSPGTCVFWDAGYEVKIPDLGFQPAALLLTRVISKPGPDRLCLDLGHKAVASENPHPRVILPDLPDARALSQSEEHLVIQTERVDQFEVGAPLYGIPWHICPTVALHAHAVIIENGRATGQWSIPARAR